MFDDSLPDGWGRLLIARRARQTGVDPAALSPLDLLAAVGSWALGALQYEPETPAPGPRGAFDLAAVADASAGVLRGAPDELFPELLRIGGSAGGARPKAVVRRHLATGAIEHGRPDAVGHGWSDWLVKFPGHGDPNDIARLECAYTAMAAAAGVEVCAVDVLPTGPRRPPCLAVRRFERDEDGTRRHAHTAAGLLHADFRLPALDYQDLVQLAATLAGQGAMAEMVRRAAFNVLARNRDDHGRQFTFLLDAAGRWSLAPAYDLTCAPGPGGEHATAVMGEGRVPGVDHLRQLGLWAGLRKGQVDAILDQVRDAVSHWRRFADDAGMARKSRDAVARVLALR